MLFKLIALMVMAHHINACCLPPSFQFTVLSETHAGGHRVRSQVLVAADAAAGKAAIFSFTEHGAARIYADFRAGSLHSLVPSYGCFVSQIQPSFFQQLNESRCAPTHLLTEAPVNLTIAGRVNATLYTGRVPLGNNATADVDAVVGDGCLPIFFKLSGRNFDSINMFGDFYPSPQPGILDLPEQCRRNATVIPSSSSGPRKREMVRFGFGANPFMV